MRELADGNGDASFGGDVDGVLRCCVEMMIMTNDGGGRHASAVMVTVSGSPWHWGDRAFGRGLDDVVFVTAYSLLKVRTVGR